MPELIVLSGLPGSGKTTEARKWLAEDPLNRLRVNWDDLRIEMFGDGWKFNQPEENKMKAESKRRAEAALKLGMSVIVDNTNLYLRTRNDWKSLALKNGASFYEQEIDTPISECVARDRLRTGKARVGRAVIERMALFTGWIDWSDTNIYPYDFVVVDMDGTLANCDWRRKLALEGPTVHKMVPGGEGGVSTPCSLTDKVNDRQCPECGGKAKKDWDLFMKDVHLDPPIQPILNLVALLHENYDIIIVSGRAIDKCGVGTEDWLLEHNIPTKHLFMRNSGDYRDDVTVKQEILDLLSKDRIKYVLDDRDGVVKMWRRNGLTCLQCADGSF